MFINYNSRVDLIRMNICVGFKRSVYTSHLKVDVQIQFKGQEETIYHVCKLLTCMAWSIANIDYIRLKVQFSCTPNLNSVKCPPISVV